MTALEGELIDPKDEDTPIAYGTGSFSPAELKQLDRWVNRDHVGRNEIKRRTGRGSSTISILAKKRGWTFERTQAMAPVIAARTVDQRLKRLELKDKLLDDGLRLRAQLWEPCELVMLNNRTGEFVRTQLTEPQFRDKQAIMVAVGIAVDKHADLDRVDAPLEGKQAVITMVEMMRLHIKPEGLPEPD